LKAENSAALQLFSPWSEEQLRVGLPPRMQRDVNLEISLARAKDVFMLPCYLLFKIGFNGFKRLVDRTVEKLSENAIELIKVLFRPATGAP
jgi:hypothetical protein